MEREDADAWWGDKLQKSYDLGLKHKHAISLLREEDFPLVDLGAGNGSFLKAVEEAFPGAGVSGVELSKVAIDRRVCKAPIEHRSVMDWEPAGKVRTAALIDVLEHVPQPRPMLAHILRFADRLILACPNFNYLVARLQMLFGRVPFQNREGRGGHVFWCQHEGVRRMFSECGLKVVEVSHLYPREGLPPMVWIGKMNPGLFSHEFVFKLEKA